MARRIARPPDRSYRAPAPPSPPRRSHAAAPVALAVLVIGLLVGRWTIVVPALLGIALLVTTGSFLSSRLNPFSLGFYLTVKPSWTSIGVVFLCSVALLAVTVEYYLHAWGPILPTSLHGGMP